MTECLNEEMRDLLPLLAHGSLAAAEADRVRAHATGCASCTTELAVVETSRLVLRASAPRVDVAGIAQAVSGARSAGAPKLRVERGGATPLVPVARRSIWRSRQLLAAAASLLIVASLSLRLLDRAPRADEGPSVTDTTTVIATDPAPALVAGSELSVGDALVDLTTDDLSTLLSELEGFDGRITLEPVTMRSPTVDTPGSR